jgi:hypothetical protein
VRNEKIVKHAIYNYPDCRKFFDRGLDAYNGRLILRRLQGGLQSLFLALEGDVVS